MVVLYVIFGFIQICLISNVIFKCTTKAPSGRRPPGSSARSSESKSEVLRSRTKSNPSQKPLSSNNNKNNRKNIRSIPSHPSKPKSRDSNPSNAAANGTEECKHEHEAELKSREMITPQPSKPLISTVRTIPSIPDEDYGEVKEPTESAKIQREKQLEKEKLEKIKKGFYQPNSNDDDTLEPIQSLKEERTENSTKKSLMKQKPPIDQ